MKRTKAFIAALSALSVTFSATSIVFAAPESRNTENVAITGDEYVEGQSNGIMLMSEGEANQSYEASVNGTNYTSFTDALNAATTGAIVKLFTHLSYQSSSSDTAAAIPLNTGNITIDLNGQTLDFNLVRFSANAKNITIKNGTINATDCAIQIPAGGELNLEDVTVTNSAGNGSAILAVGTLNVTDSTIKGTLDAIFIRGGKVTVNGSSYLSGSGFDAIFIRDKGAELTINDGTIEGAPYYAILGNGSNEQGNYQGGTKININGGNIVSEGIGMYLPQYGEVNITGGSIQGVETAIEIESGILNIKGGTLTATTDECGFLNPKDGDGTTTSGAAVAAVCRTLPGKNYEGGGGYYGNMDINISGGTFNGVCGVAKFIYQNCDENSSMKNMSITGGTFNGKEGKDINGGDVKASAVYMADDCNNKSIISGGIFNTDVTSYLADGTAYSSDNGEYTVYSATNKITGAGTYRTISNDGKYDQLTMVDWKPTTQTTALSDVKFNIKFSDNTTAEYKYINAGTTVTTDGIVRIGLIVTDIPAEINTTITTIQ